MPPAEALTNLNAAGVRAHAFEGKIEFNLRQGKDWDVIYEALSGLEKLPRGTDSLRDYLLDLQMLEAA